MKTKLILLSLLTAINSYATSFTWDEGPDHVNIVGSGTGLLPFESTPYSNLSGVEISPSGLWELAYRQVASYSTSTSGDLVSHFFELNMSATLTWLGDLPADFVGLPTIDGTRDHYIDLVAPGHFLVTGTGWSGLPSGPDVGPLWHGTISMLVTSTPVLNDPSTWSWISSYRVSGPALNVPEGGSTWLLLSFASIVLLCFRPKAA